MALTTPVVDGKSTELGDVAGLLAEYLPARTTIHLASSSVALRNLRDLPLALDSVDFPRLRGSPLWKDVHIGRFCVLELEAIVPREYAAARCLQDALSLPGLKQLSLRGAELPLTQRILGDPPVDGIEDLTPILAATTLRSLYLGAGIWPYRWPLQPVTLPSLSRSALTSLSLDGAAITDLSGVATAPALSELELRNLLLPVDLAPLVCAGSRCPWVLRTLRIFSCRLQGLTPLGELRALELLDLSSCVRVHDLSPLARLGRLRILTLTHCEVQSLAPLVSCAALRDISLFGCEGVSDVTPLARCPALSTVTFPGGGEIGFGPSPPPLPDVERILRLMLVAESRGRRPAPTDPSLS
mmetsp:Transcript_16815/g.55161  ORF Transcript_16815/g.55161 Transcript_16815/m.55161 type:complete len:356 (-) Transcript_16815:1180-2247(-)